MYNKKVGFLKGLAEGLALDGDSKEGKLFAAIIDTLDAMSETIDTMHETIEDLQDEIDELSESVDSLEDEMDDYSGFMDALESAAEEGGSLRQFPDLGAFGDYDDDDDDDDPHEYEITCPGCNNEFIVDEETIFAGKAVCPSCKESLTLANCGGGCCGQAPEDKDEN